jgi:hypothetical protein
MKPQPEVFSPSPRSHPALRLEANWTIRENNKKPSENYEN